MKLTKLSLLQNLLMKKVVGNLLRGIDKKYARFPVLSSQLNFCDFLFAYRVWEDHRSLVMSLCTAWSQRAISPKLYCIFQHTSYSQRVEFCWGNGDTEKKCRGCGGVVQECKLMFHILQTGGESRVGLELMCVGTAINSKNRMMINIANWYSLSVYHIFEETSAPGAILHAVRSLNYL